MREVRHRLLRLSIDMAIRKIVQYPDVRLQRVGRLVEQIDEEVKQIIADMFETHYASVNCAALAATQLDFADPYRITVIDFSDNKDQPLCLINPEIIAYSAAFSDQPEGCMSVAASCHGVAAELYERVKRAQEITVRYQNERCEWQEMHVDGFMAKCIQHELDHLDGKIFLDRLSPIKRERLLAKLRKQRKKLLRDN